MVLLQYQKSFIQNMSGSRLPINLISSVQSSKENYYSSVAINNVVYNGCLSFLVEAFSTGLQRGL